MGAWIVAITGVICLGILLDIVLPSGQTTKYIRGAFSLIVVLVIVSPIPSLVKKDWQLKFDDFQFSSTQSESATATDVYGASIKRCEENLKAHGIDAKVEGEFACGVTVSVIVRLQDRSVSGARVVDIVADVLQIAPHKIRVLYE